MQIDSFIIFVCNIVTMLIEYLKIPRKEYSCISQSYHVFDSSACHEFLQTPIKSKIFTWKPMSMFIVFHKFSKQDIRIRVHKCYFINWQQGSTTWELKTIF